VILIRFAGPLIHEHLLEFDRECTSPFLVATVDPATQLASAKSNVFPDVESTAAGLLGRE